MIRPQDPAVARMKARLHCAPYEVCLARARHFTDTWRENPGEDPATLVALALRRTLERQAIRIEPDERLAGTRTERFLASPLAVERGDFLRTLQLELDVLDRKRRPFLMSAEDRRHFREAILPFWDGRTVRDRKAREWVRRGVIDPDPTPLDDIARTVAFVAHLGRDRLRKVLGAGLQVWPTPQRLADVRALRHQIAHNNPTPAISCFDMQGHLCLGIDRVLERGLDAIAAEARGRLAGLDPADRRAPFLRAAAVCLEAAVAYAHRFADLAGSLAAAGPGDRDRLLAIEAHCRRVPGQPPRTFHEALQAAWLTQAVAEIQFGTMDVFAQGRADQYLLPFYRRDVAAGTLAPDGARALLQEWFLKLSANVAPTPELGMETNGVLGNSQHCVTIGGVGPDGGDATNELSWLMLDAYEEMGGCVNEIAVRVDEGTPEPFVRRAVEVFRTAGGLSFYGDRAIVAGLEADGYEAREARNYCIVGCVEPAGHSDTQGCVAAHELVLPAALMMALTRGRRPPPAPGQSAGLDCGDPACFLTFERLMAAVRLQISHQVCLLVEAIAGRDEATRDLLPAPFVSALVDGCVEAGADVSAGGARHDFTSIVFRGLATFVDSLLAIRWLVHERAEMDLASYLAVVRDDFRGREDLRCRVVREAPKYGCGDPAADDLALEVLRFLHDEVSRYRNVRGGRYRVACFSYGNHVIDGFFLGATPDGRRAGDPVSNGASPSNLAAEAAGLLGPLRTVGRFPPGEVSGGVALNVRLHPSFLDGDNGVAALASVVRAHLRTAMHVAPNVVSTETLRDAQAYPERHRDLVVKVSGYSACFVDLGRSIQDDIIDRVELSGGG